MQNNEDKLPQQENRFKKYELPKTPKTEAKRESKQSLSLPNRKSSDMCNSSQGTLSFNSPKVIDITQRDSIFENLRDGELSARGDQSVRVLPTILNNNNFNVQKKRNNFSLNLVSRLNIDDKNKMPRLAPVTTRHQNSPDPKGKEENIQTIQKYAQGKELPDYKQYNGPFNILHIPEDGVQIEIDESEIDIIDKIANIDGQENENNENKMSYFTEIKNNIVKNQADYYNQYKKIQTILDAEQFFGGNKVSNYSQMLQNTQINKAFPMKLGLLKPFISSEFTQKNMTRKDTDVSISTKNQNLQTPINSQRSILLSQQISSNLPSPSLRKKPSIQVAQKQLGSNRNFPIMGSNSPKGKGKTSLFQIALQKGLSQNLSSKKIILGKSNSNVPSISNISDFGNLLNTPQPGERNFKSSKFRQDSDIFNKKLKLMSLKSNESIYNKYSDENGLNNQIDREGLQNYDDQEEIQSPIMRQMQAKLPFFMKVQDKQTKGIKGDGLISEINRLIKQKMYISPEDSQRIIPFSSQNSQKTISSAVGRSEMRLQTEGPSKDNAKKKLEMRKKAKTETREDDDLLNLNHFSINDKYANILSAGVNEVKKFKVIRLSNNRITDSGLNSILSSMPINVKNIDISYNSFTHLGLETFIERIGNADFNQLQEINMEGNNLGDKSISKLLQALTDYPKLKKLNISKNSLTILCVPSLTNFMLQNISIKELYLRWNKFKEDAGIKIAEALIENLTIKVIDLSFNSLGTSSNDKYLCPKEFAKLLEKDYKSEIIHIDLSYNQFNFEATTIISKSLQKNSCILGFHFNGNNGYMDQYGFLHPISDISDVIPLETRIQGVKKIESSNKKIDASQEICWICQGWEERKFVWRPLISGEVQEEPIFVHVSTEQFQPRKMEKEVNGNLIQYVYRNMCPPNTKVCYFFVAHGHCLYAKEQTNEEINIENVSISYKEETVIIPFIPILNTFMTSKQNQIVDEEKYESKIRIFPRREQILYSKPQQKELKIIWNLNMSVFNEYQNELDEQLIDQCFEFDLKNSQIESEITVDFLSFKKSLKSHYKQIKDPFMGERWTIPMEVFIQLLNSGPIEIVDEKNLKKCSIAVIFDQMNQGEKKSINIPQKHLTRLILYFNYQIFNHIFLIYRHTFLLALLRVAEIKYIQTGIAADHKRALEYFFEKGFQKVCDLIQCEHDWRINNLWNQDVDLVLQYYKPLINYMFNKVNNIKFSSFFLITKIQKFLQYFLKKYSQKTPHDQQFQQVIQQTIIQQANNNQSQNGSNSGSTSNILKFISLTEFKAFIYENIKEFSILSIIDIQKCFNLSIQTQVDQINKNRHVYMNLIEFYEALTRLAQLLIIYPVGYEFLNESTLNHFKDMPLCCKLESMLVKIFQKRKDETKLLSEITVSQTSLFDLKIREFLYVKKIISPQLERKDSFQVNMLPQLSNRSLSLMKKPSLVLPTPVDFAESTYQNSNPELGGLSNLEYVVLDSRRSVLVDGKVVRRSNSVLQNLKSIYFKPPSEENVSISQFQSYDKD